MGKRSESVTRELRELILSGDYQPGEPLQEDRVAGRLHASRTPVRIALMRLEVEGLATYAMNRGFTVRRYSAMDIAATVRIRAALEGLACRIIAEDGPRPDTLAALGDCLDRIDMLLERGKGADVLRGPLPDLVERYHATIVEASGRARLIEEIRRTTLVPIPVNGHYRWVSQERAATAAGHGVESLAQFDRRRVVDAIARREGPRAEMLMREHMFTVHEILLRMVGADVSERSATRAPG